MNKSEKIIWIDLVRISAIFGVVLLHTVAPYAYKFGQIPMNSWWMVNILDSLVRICVPLFFMISGYLLLSKQDNLSQFYLKRIKKVVIPLIFWSIVYLLWKQMVFPGYEISVKSFYRVLISPTYYHLWFIYALLGIYFVTPIVRIFVKNSSKKLIYYLIVVWFIAVSIIPIIEKFTARQNNIDFGAISGYIGYFVVGWFLGRIKTSKRLFTIAGLVFCTMYLFTVFVTYYLSSRSGEFNEYFYGYLSPNIILLSVSAFIIVKNKFENKLISKDSKVLITLEYFSSASLGIYLVHPIISHHLTENLVRNNFNPSAVTLLIFILFIAVFVFLLSFTLIMILKKIPLLKVFVP